jgi:hypothetical protein
MPRTDWLCEGIPLRVGIPRQFNSQAIEWLFASVFAYWSKIHLGVSTFCSFSEMSGGASESEPR